MHIVVIDQNMPCPAANRQNPSVAEPRLFYLDVDANANGKILVGSDWAAFDNVSYSHYEDEFYYREVDDQFNQVIHPDYWEDFTDELKAAYPQLFSLESFKDEYPEWYEEMI